jgi:hypothetical protein
MFLSMVIPGPSSPGWNIDVCLRSLIDELTQLWFSRVLTYDISRKHNFVIRAVLMWTINDSQLMEWFLVGAHIES